MSDVTKLKGLISIPNSIMTKLEIKQVRNKTRIFVEDAFERWRRLKAKKSLKSDIKVADFQQDR